MVEMHYPPTEDRALFDELYARHISMLLTIDGFLSAQRYKCTHAARAPFLAVYRLRDPAVMTSESYTSKAGRNSVNPTFRAKMTNWDRNLVQSDLADMDVPEGGWLVPIDRLTPEGPPLPEGLTPLRIVSLDATIAERGVHIGRAARHLCRPRRPKARPFGRSARPTLPAIRNRAAIAQTAPAGQAVAATMQLRHALNRRWRIVPPLAERQHALPESGARGKAKLVLLGRLAPDRPGIRVQPAGLRHMSRRLRNAPSAQKMHPKAKTGVSERDLRRWPGKMPAHRRR
jgi:hypothetical protein